MDSESLLEPLRAVIVSSFPDLAGASFSLLGLGWHSVAVDVEDRLVFKFPRSEAGAEALAKEARLLAVIRSAVSMPVPDLTLHPGPPLFSSHRKIAGQHLTSAQYRMLPERVRDRLAGRLAEFYADLHQLDAITLQSAGAAPIPSWLSPDRICAAIPMLPEGLRDYADRALDAYRSLPPDPYGSVFGFFDGHGWNMAFDHTVGELTGIYDFGDSGFGPLHQEFIYSNFVSADLTERILSGYEALTGRNLDRERITILTAAHRLSEFAELADDSEHRDMMIRHVAEWASQR